MCLYFNESVVILFLYTINMISLSIEHLIILFGIHHLNYYGNACYTLQYNILDVVKLAIGSSVAQWVEHVHIIIIDHF